MPHLMNCPHMDDGWCLSCVRELWEESEKRRECIKALLVRFDDFNSRFYPDGRDQIFEEYNLT